MKLICVDDQVEVSYGFLGLKRRMEKSKKLTKFKVYNSFSTVISSSSGIIQDRDVRFVVFDDSGEWSVHHPKRFKPAE